MICASPAEKRQVVYSKPQNRVKKFAAKQLLKRMFDATGPLLSIFLTETFDERPLFFRLPVCIQHSQWNLSDVVDITAIGNLKHAKSARVSNVHPDFVSAVSAFTAKQWENLG